MPRGSDQMSEEVIRFEGVVKRFGALTILDGLDLSVRKGEKVSLIGPSGSGKTTILRILMTLENIQGGVVTVLGRPLWHMEGRPLVPADEAICGRCAATSAWSLSSISTCSRT